MASLSDVFQGEDKRNRREKKPSYFYETLNLNVHQRVTEQRRDNLWTERNQTNSLSPRTLLFLGPECRLGLSSAEAVCCTLLDTERLQS